MKSRNETEIYKEELVILDDRRLCVEWSEPTSITEDKDGNVWIYQNDDIVLIPWPYIRAITAALGSTHHGKA